MKKILSYILYAWSAYIFLHGILISIFTAGTVQSTEFTLQVGILGTIGSILIWLGIFGVWFVLPKPESKSD